MKKDILPSSPESRTLADEPKSLSRVALEDEGSSAVGEAVAAVHAPSLRGIGKVRWSICALLFFATTINYLDRQVLGVLAPTLQDQIGWNEVDYGHIVLAFQAAYAIGLLAAGGFMDRIGTRLGYALSIGFWSLAAMGHALAHSVGGFGTARFALGLSEAGNFPAAIKTVAKWFPKSDRALVTGIFNAGSNVGAIVAPFSVPFITLKYGWRVAFIVTGAVGFVWLLAWLLLYRRPEEHPLRASLHGPLYPPLETKMNSTSDRRTLRLPAKKTPISSLTFAAALVAGLGSSSLCVAAPLQSLVPTTTNTSPDYFCTWNIQGYYTSYVKGKEKGQMKAAVDESQLFGQGQYQNWLGQFPKVQQDLYFLLDEGWDLPKQQIEVVSEMFPSYAVESQPEGFKRLSDAVKGKGWRGLGLWMRADKKTDEFWAERMRWMQTSGVAYWKVDYGNDSRDEIWRRHLTDMGRQIAPDLIIETAMIPHAITFGDTFRTYDVDVPLSIPQTLSRVVTQLPFKAEPPAKGIVNCEDEMYLGAALGCAYGVMRHSFAGNLPSGRQDHVFPPLARDLKLCMDEVVRAVRWHHIAPAFAVGANAVAVSPEQLTDTFLFQKDESWRHAEGKQVSESAPAAVTRGLPLPEVTLASGTVKPFVVASRSPNGAVAIATLGRTLNPTATDRQWITGEVADVMLRVGQSGPIGVFGRYHSLTLAFDKSITGRRIIAQDLAGEAPQDITDLVRVADNNLTIPGAVIDRIGLSAATPGDKSEPGLVVVIQPK